MNAPCCIVLQGLWGILLDLGDVSRMFLIIDDIHHFVIYRM